MKIKFWETEPWYIFHIMINVGFLFAFFFLGEKLLHLSELNYIWMFVFWCVALYLGDRATHFILQKD